jgi:serine-type D-Ala-D-Ala carboxypeptidase/endopeptidase (penicillin-binding protein 4)
MSLFRSSSASPRRTPSGRAGVLVILGCVLALGMPLGGEGQAVRSPVDPAVLPADLPPWIRGLRDEVESILPRSRWPTARWGILAVSLVRGDTLVAADPDALLAPASNVKLLTSAAALDLLGPDFRYTTYLLSQADVVDGVLRGDLILLGTGDPTLSEQPGEDGLPPFTSMARHLRERGIRRVDGNIVGDASLFPGPDRGAGWNPTDYNDWFAAPSTALAYTENVVSLRVAPATGVGARPSVRVEPAGAPVAVINEARTVAGAPRSPLVMVRRDPADPIRLVGEVGARRGEIRRTVTVSDPAIHAATGLRRALEAEGIAVVGHTVAVRNPDESLITGARTWAPAFGRAAPRVLAFHRSPRMQEILTVVNHQSHNLYADMVARTVGRIERGDGSFEGASRAVEGFVVRRTGLPPEQVALEDGSGLSRLNRASAGVFVEVLRAMAGDALWPTYLATLPEAGGRSLRRMQRSVAAGNLRAKTGTIQSVSALSGVVHSVDGEPVLFSILANGLPGAWLAKGLEDRIGIRLAGVQRPLEGIPEPTGIDPVGVSAPATDGLDSSIDGANEQAPSSVRLRR